MFVSIADIKNEQMTITSKDICERMNYTMVLGMVLVSSLCKRRCLSLKTLLSRSIRMLPSSMMCVLGLRFSVFKFIPVNAICRTFF